MILVVALIQVVAVLDALRWLRVAQREHYIAGSVTRFAARWWRVGIGLPLRGRTSKLVWTRRLRVLAAITTVIHVGVFFAFVPLLPLWAASLISLVLLPATVDGALLVATPFEARALAPFIAQATAKLKQINPTIVGITGSYGKTSTKVVLGHLVEGTKTVAASPASFNNKAGLARAVNEGLSPGTEVFVAEMGTYGVGEIAALCEWCPPTISIITAIGPVHLERFGSEDVTLEAKSEILNTATGVILNEDDARLANLADRLQSDQTKHVVRVSGTRADADVAVLADDDGARIYESGELIGRVSKLPTAATNVACAVAAARALGVPAADVVKRLETAPVASHRLETATAASGAVVLDDTFNSNPAGARRALAMLAASGAPGGRKVLMTPGMIELGPRQAEENEKFAADAGKVATIVGIIGRTNRKALRNGLVGATAEVKLFRNREKAAEWVRANLTAGDAVLYENDLPDVYK